VGLVLLAPALYLSGYVVQDPTHDANRICVAHGWREDVVPPAHGIRFAEQYRTELHVLDADHRLNAVLPVLGKLFAEFLQRVLDSAIDGTDAC
jgi:hypothetical protein